eukprot:Gb_14088 [translate_table: standard]
MGICVEATTLVMAIAALLVQTSLSAQYTVGDNQGWDSSTDLNTWISGKKFSTGDTLVFKYTSFHSLVEVNKAGYDSCSTANSVRTHSDGNTVITLSSAGKRYFICGTPGHCSGGMKVEVDTQLAVSAPKTSPASPSPSAAAPPNVPSSSPSVSPTAAAPTPKTTAPSVSAPNAGSLTPPLSLAPAASPPAQNGATICFYVNTWVVLVTAISALLLL